MAFGYLQKLEFCWLRIALIEYCTLAPLLTLPFGNIWGLLGLKSKINQSNGQTLSTCLYDDFVQSEHPY